MPSLPGINISLLIHSNNTDGSTDIVDSSSYNHTLSLSGDIQHKTDQYKFPLSSIYADGSDDRISVPANDAFDMATGAFTLGCWYRPGNKTTSYPRVMQLGTGWGADQINLCDRHNSAPTKFFVQAAGEPGYNLLESSTVVTIGQWYYLELSRDSAGTVYLFVDGVLEDSATGKNFSVNSTGKTCWIFDSGTGAEEAQGWGEEFFVLKGACLHTESFTPPSAPWAVPVHFNFEQNITSIIHLQSTQIMDKAARLNHQMMQVLISARKISLSHSQIFDTMFPVHMQHDQVFHGMAEVVLTFTQVLRCYGPQAYLEHIQTWAAHDYNLAFLPFIQVMGSQLDAIIQEIQFSVIIAGTRVGVTDCKFERKRFANVAALLLRSRADWINKDVGDPVVLTVLGEQYQMIVVNKPQDEQVGQASYEVGYTLECASVTVQLAEGINPDISASRVTASFPAGTMLTEILDILTDGVCDYILGVNDFQVGAYDFKDAERYSALRTVLPEDYGWLINTDKDGLLQIRQWAMPNIGSDQQNTITFEQKILTPPYDTLYTQVDIKNYSQTDGTSGLILEVEDNGDGTGTFYGYSVPWTEAFSIFDSKDAPAPSLLIDGGDVEEVEVEDTDVEFLLGEGTISKPCYSVPIIDWGTNDSLSPVIYDESGVLTTSIDPGYSVAVGVKYFTRRKKWNFDNRTIDISQVRIKYDATN